MDILKLPESAALLGVVGGVVGIISFVWTVAWSIVYRPRVRWSLNRILLRDCNSELNMIALVFRNVGTAAAEDSHAVMRAPHLDGLREFPSEGRLRVEPGGEIQVLIQAHVRRDERALQDRRIRPYMSGDATMFEMSKLRITLRWRRQTFGFARRWFWPNRLQYRVPLGDDLSKINNQPSGTATLAASPAVIQSS
ncbi:hypothetical protein E3O25_14355 [Cryobacterium sp. TMT1-3]|uniref:hypothetical protein n=1 Tax=Cryobacterium sp. TMT1-3 TaxID=1259237 RepID=UPI00106C30EB|nr:hypothetical protein [Cryobacterium sp. TMT1-3]TFC25175.1 hypothetical protein E3O25_14355 [Cryobacterium sp. TMT1-3]